jgi:hypothetical protein
LAARINHTWTDGRECDGCHFKRRGAGVESCPDFANTTQRVASLSRFWTALESGTPETLVIIASWRVYDLIVDARYSQHNKNLREKLSRMRCFICCHPSRWNHEDVWRQLKDIFVKHLGLSVEDCASLKRLRSPDQNGGNGASSVEDCALESAESECEDSSGKTNKHS